MSSSAPRRDKFAALAQQQQVFPIPPLTTSNDDDHPEGSESVTLPFISAVVITTTPHDVGSNPVVLPNPRRDKLAAWAQHQHSNETRDSTDPQAPHMSREQPHSALLRQPNTREPPHDDHVAVIATLRARAQQRQAVWDDLDRAEAAVMHLLQTARNTAHQLAAHVSQPESMTTTAVRPTHPTQEEDAAAEESPRHSFHPSRHSTTHSTTKKSAKASSVKQCTVHFQRTLQSIYETLAPHADLVHAYQAPRRHPRMYHARVERRLAHDRQALLSTWRQLESHPAGHSTEPDQWENGGERSSATLVPSVDRGNETSPVIALGNKRPREE